MMVSGNKLDLVSSLYLYFMVVVTTVTKFVYKIDFVIFNFVSIEKGTLETLYFHLILNFLNMVKCSEYFFSLVDNYS